jgi:hypothetical protein
MFNHAMYWGQVLSKQAELEQQFASAEVIYITSVSDPLRGLIGGRVVDTSLRLGTSKYGVAAKQLVDGTHRLSTPDEIAAFHEEQKRRSADCAALQSRIDRRGHSVLYVNTKELEALAEA